ncbi:MAG: hypothetical protein H6R07_1481 [Proteobacteria bacterium]|nr:hypothetical protein [Pseudomonadota bacterium]
MSGHTSTLVSCIKPPENDEFPFIYESIWQFFDGYRKVYSCLDVDGVTARFTLPFTAFHHGEPSSWNQQEAELLYAVTDSLLNYFRSQNVVDISGKLESVLPMGRHMASAVMTWTARRQDQTAWVFNTGYHLIRTEDSWKIYGVIQFDE